jgi:hypothetical protein
MLTKLLNCLHGARKQTGRNDRRVQNSLLGVVAACANGHCLVLLVPLLLLLPQGAHCAV